jgi:hypothetical protein
VNNQGEKRELILDLWQALSSFLALLPKEFANHSLPDLFWYLLHPKRFELLVIRFLVDLGFLQREPAMASRRMFPLTWLRQQKLVQCFVAHYAGLQHHGHASTEPGDQTKCHSSHPKHKLQLSPLLAQRQQREFQPQCLLCHEELKASFGISGLGHHRRPGLQLRILDSQVKRVLQLLDRLQHDPEQQQLPFPRLPRQLWSIAQVKLLDHHNQL